MSQNGSAGCPTPPLTLFREGVGLSKDQNALGRPVRRDFFSVHEDPWRPILCVATIPLVGVVLFWFSLASESLGAPPPPNSSHSIFRKS